VTKIPLLLDIFPGAKILHIYRDGRDVAVSWLRIRFGPRNLFSAATAWKNMVGAGCQAGAALPPETYLEVRYESLISHPEYTMKQVCEFIGEPFTDAVLRPTAMTLGSRHRHLIGARLPRWSPAREILSANAGKWRKQMSLSDKVLFESVAGDLLAALGYETEGATRRITMPERVMWEAHNLVLWSLIRVNTVGNHRLLTDYLAQKWANFRHRLRAVG
jgi:hypothetical protein